MQIEFVLLFLKHFLRQEGRIWKHSSKTSGFPGGSVVKNLPASEAATGHVGLIPGLGRSPERGHGDPFQCSCLENPMGKGAWKAIVHRVTESDTSEVIKHACKNI